VGEAQVKRPTGRIRRRRNGYVKAGSKVRNTVGVTGCIHLNLDRKWWRTVVDRLYKHASNLLGSGGSINFLRQTLLCVRMGGF